MPHPPDTDPTRRSARPVEAILDPLRKLSRTQRAWALALSIGLLIVLVMAALFSDGLWPETRAQQLRREAAEALARGHLTAPDGSGARELYEAALALDPDRPDARDGLTLVGHAALARADAQIDAGHFAQARQSLALARAMTVPQPRLVELETRLHRRELGDAGVERLLDVADAARRGGRLDGEGYTALRLYQRVLALEPDNVRALEGREDTLSELLAQSRSMLERGALTDAAAVQRRVAQADAGHVELPEARAALAAAVDARLSRAEADLQRGRLAEALAGFRAALDARPDDVRATSGVRRSLQAYVRRVVELAADFRFSEAEAALAQAVAVDPDMAGLDEARRRLAAARATQARLGGEGATQTAAGRGRIRALLAEAARARDRGDLLTPPGESAFDKIAAARALAPRDAEVREAADALLPAAQRCFEDALRENRLIGAGACLEAREALGEPRGTALAARRRLAQRWLAVGEERLGASEITAAQRALDQARTLDPDADGVDAFARRVEAASAALD